MRRLKTQALTAAFDRFVDSEWQSSTSRAGALARYIEEQSWWLPDYALFRALRARHRRRSWLDWTPELQRRDPGALHKARVRLERQVLFFEYVQWIADMQWREMRERIAPTGVFGDFPFMVSTDSADVWARQDEFVLDGSVGVPPDAFSDTGQNWGLPPYRWDVVKKRGYDWLRQRARRLATLCDGYRVDHLVGFYRTYVIPNHTGPTRFVPAEPAEQLEQGEEVLAALAEAGARVTAEDLGTVPDFVRASLARIGVAGYKVLRWEREWTIPGKPFIDPASYPRISVATSGTHDTEPMATWWDEADITTRRLLTELAGMHEMGALEPGGFGPQIRDALLETLFASRSDLLILPIQDVFGWTDRINLPATVSRDNWTYKLPWPVDQLHRQPEALERAAALSRWSLQYGRMG